MRGLLPACGLLLLASQALAAGNGTLPLFDSRDLTPVFDSSRISPARVTGLSLVNQSGQAVTDESLSGHPSLVNFFFTGCGSMCPLMMQSLAKLQPELARFAALRLYSLSVTPDEDTPAALKRYASTRNIDLTRWDLLTGPKSQIYRIGNDIFRANRQIGRQDPSSFIHTENIYLLDGERRIRGIYKALDKDSLKLLLKDLAELEKTGPPR